MFAYGCACAQRRFRLLPKPVSLLHRPTSTPSLMHMPMFTVREQAGNLQRLSHVALDETLLAQCPGDAESALLSAVSLTPFFMFTGNREVLVGGSCAASLAQ